MKKSLVSLFSLSLLGSAHAGCDNSVSFSGAFGGLGAVISFDKDTILDQTSEGTSVVEKKSKTAFGGQIVLGYGHQLDNNVYIALMHESNFLSKAKHDVARTADNGLDGDGEFMKTSRKVWTPSFGVALGYIVDDINFGIRGGISLNKFKFEQHTEHLNGDTQSNTDTDNGKSTKSTADANETVSETSPYIGLYVEKKFGDFIGYMNVDYVFKKQKFAHKTTFNVLDENTPPNALLEDHNTHHKRPSWKVAVGVKYHLPIF